MSNWPSVRLSDLADIRFSNVDKKFEPTETPVRLCNYMDVYGNGGYINAELPFMEASASRIEIERFGVANGDVMITKDSETPDDIGVPAVVVEDIPGLVCGYHLALIKANREKIDPIYLAKQLGNKSTASYFSRLANGSTRYGLSSSAIASTRIPLAPLPQQRHIAEILTTLDETIEQTEALIAKHQQIKAGLMHDLFTRGITPDDRLRPTREEAPQLYKESPLGWVPKEWEIRRLDSVSDVNRGKFAHRPRNEPRFYGGRYPFIQTGDVALSEGGKLFNYSQTLNESGLAISRIFPANTVMVTIAANIADTCIIGIPMCVPDSLVAVQPNDAHDARFIELSIRRRKSWLIARAPQTAQKNINLEDLRPLKITWPQIEERMQISSIYEAHDSVLKAFQDNMAKLQQQKHGLMHDLLTGRVRVSAPEAAAA